MIEEIDFGVRKSIDHGKKIRKAAFYLLKGLLNHRDTVELENLTSILADNLLVDIDGEILLLNLICLLRICRRSTKIVLDKIGQIIAGFERLFDPNLKLVK